MGVCTPRHQDVGPQAVDVATSPPRIEASEAKLRKAGFLFTRLPPPRLRNDAGTAHSCHDVRQGWT